jgi:hypothetical protein
VNRTRPNRALWTRLAPLLLVLGCGGDGPERQPADPADSAVAAWTFGGEPLVTTSGGLEPFVQVTSAVRTRPGIVVADAGTKRLAFFDSSGTFVRTAGREGRGPGEFQYPGWVGPGRRDSVVAWDPFQARISVFSSDGKLGRTSEAAVAAFFPAVHGVFSDGSLLVSAPPLTGKAPVSPGRAWRDTVPYLRVASTGEILDTVGRFPGMEQYESPSPDRRTFRTVSLPFGRWTSAAVAGDRFFVATGDEYRVDAFTHNGTPHSAVRRPVQPLPLTRADVAEYTRRVVEGAGSRAAEERAELAAAPMPKTIPPTGAMLTDAEGRLWVQEGQPMTDVARGSRWSVFDARGRRVARASGPARFTPFQIGREWVLGRYTDADGVQHVQLLRLAGPSPTR